MMELGNQQMYFHASVPEGSPAKAFFAARGVRHTSVDLNGELGAVPLDLSQIVDEPDWTGAFDVVTDFGTSEHIGPGLPTLYACRANCHNWCRAGGVMLFVNPKTGNWPGHGYHYFTVKHYEALAASAGYRLLESSEHPTLGDRPDDWMIHAALLKPINSPFISLEEFTSVCSDTLFTA
jgi:hypothetical protein